MPFPLPAVAVVKLPRCGYNDDTNKQFEPVRTEADWLSRDSAEVDKYLADPLCRFRPALQLWIDLLDALREIAKPARQARIPKQLPIEATGNGDYSGRGRPQPTGRRPWA
jgi:alpha-beta hydrolase superfamily lysophospholipase